MPKDNRSKKIAACVSSNSISLDITPSVIPRRESLTNSSVKEAEPSGTPKIWILSVGVIGTPAIGLSNLHSGSSQDHSHFFGFNSRPKGGPPSTKFATLSTTYLWGQQFHHHPCTTSGPAIWSNKGLKTTTKVKR